MRMHLIFDSPVQHLLHRYLIPLKRISVFSACSCLVDTKKLAIRKNKCFDNVSDDCGRNEFWLASHQWNHWDVQYYPWLIQTANIWRCFPFFGDYFNFLKIFNFYSGILIQVRQNCLALSVPTRRRVQTRHLHFNNTFPRYKGCITFSTTICINVIRKLKGVINLIKNKQIPFHGVW